MTEISAYRDSGLVQLMDARSRSNGIIARPFHLPGRHLPALDGVRGVAVFLVMGFHFSMLFGETTPLSHAIAHVAILGRCGVDLFFVLSGFLITGILYDAKKSQGYFKTFYARRVLRILPLYFATLILLLMVVPRALGRVPHGYNDVLDHQSWLWLHAVNIGLIWMGPSHFGTTGHLWSLAIEEHFYLVWPLVVFCFSREKLVKVCVAIAIASLGLRIVLMAEGDYSWICYLLTPCRFDQLAIGALVALVARGRSGLTPLVRPAKWIAPISFLILLSIFAMRDRFHDPEHDDVLMPTIGYSVLALGFAACIVLAIMARPETVSARLLLHPLLRKFGKFSYALYIFHPFVMTRILLLRPTGDFSSARVAVIFVVFGVIGFATSFGVAWISWNLLEKHFMKLKRFFVYRVPSTAFVGAVAVAS